MLAPLGMDFFLQLSCFNSHKPMLWVDGFMEQKWQDNPAYLLPCKVDMGSVGESSRTFCNNILTNKIRS